MVARYNVAVACTATNVYIRLGFAKRIAQDKLNAEVTVVSFYISYDTDGPNSLEVNFGHRICYFVNGYNNCYIWRFLISLHV